MPHTFYALDVSGWKIISTLSTRCKLEDRISSYPQHHVFAQEFLLYRHSVHSLKEKGKMAHLR